MTADYADPAATVSESADPLDLVRRRYVVRMSRTIDLNMLKLRMSSNLREFEGFAYFSTLLDPDVPADYTLTCVDLDKDPIDEVLLREAADRTYRAERFQAGYYLAHHFGAPAFLVTRGTDLFVFGRQLEKTVWPYFVKHLLTIFAVDRGLLHLKAAAFVQPGVGATLLVGRGSGGKTVFLTRACTSGAAFLSNTHVLVDGRTVHGVPSAMRVRNDECFRPLIESGGLSRHLESHEYRADPRAIFPSWQLSAPIRNLCVVDYQPNWPPVVEELGAEECYEFLDQFSAAVGTYGLKDDVLAHLDGDFHRYVRAAKAFRQAMTEVVLSARRFRINADMFDKSTSREVLRTLAGDTR
ncbi:FomB family phosphonate monophosphate kinase [Micromonospora sp. NPDC051196]|uniref:FomB family phosphonate monophosphate kinase n=1 Tax=Micromonospora sp. NPDC051196 TaxID=3155281 RepID=UPI003417AB98